MRDANGVVRVRTGFPDGPPSPNSPRYAKWNVVTRAVEDINTFSWPLGCDTYIYYREPNQAGENKWYAYSGRTGAGRVIYEDDVPGEVKLAMVLAQ